MYQVNATLAILLSFFMSFVDELSELGEISNKKMLLIIGGMVVVYLIYKEKSDDEKKKEEVVQLKKLPNFGKKIKL